MFAFIVAALAILILIASFFLVASLFDYYLEFNASTSNRCLFRAIVSGCILFVCFSALCTVKDATRPRRGKVVERWIKRVLIRRSVGDVIYTTYREHPKARILDPEGRMQEVNLTPAQFESIREGEETEIDEVIGRSILGFTFSNN